MANYGYTGRTEFGDSGLVHPVTTVQKVAGLMNLRKTTLPGGFFVYGQRLLFAGLILNTISFT
jgi:hypothetical protein